MSGPPSVLVPDLNHALVAEDLMVPAQWQAEPAWTPAQRLCFALVDDAIRCALRGAEDDQAWLRSADDAPFSARYACAALGRSYDAMLRMLDAALVTGHPFMQRRPGRPARRLVA